MLVRTEMEEEYLVRVKAGDGSWFVITPSGQEETCAVLIKAGRVEIPQRSLREMFRLPEEFLATEEFAQWSRGEFCDFEQLLEMPCPEKGEAAERVQSFRNWISEVMQKLITEGEVVEPARIRGTLAIRPEYYRHLAESVEDIMGGSLKPQTQLAAMFTLSVDYDLRSEEAERFFALLEKCSLQKGPAARAADRLSRLILDHAGRGRMVHMKEAEELLYRQLC